VTSKNFAQDWTLDQLGNWPTFKQDDNGNGTWDLNQGRTHNEANELTHIDSSNSHVAEDAAGNMTKIPQPTSWSAHFDLKYDAWNRLVEVKSGATVVQANKYDALGRRIVRDETGGSGVLRHYYYNEAWQALEERTGTSTSAERQYVWHPHYIDALALTYDSAGTVHWYLQDANFNVTAVVNTSAEVQERYNYTPYGEVTFLEPDFDVAASQASTISNAHLYTGRERDAVTGLQLNRLRNFAIHTGRWLTRDPVGYFGVQWNLYEYVSSKPCCWQDSMGLLPIPPEPPVPPDLPPPGPEPPPNVKTNDCKLDDSIRCPFLLTAPLCFMVKCPPGYQCLTWRLRNSFQVACIKCSGDCECERGKHFHCSPRIGRRRGGGRGIGCDCNLKWPMDNVLAVLIPLPGKLRCKR
jgi:RHS repeat-associated protein